MKKPLSGYESLKKYLVESCGAEDLDELKPRPPQGMRISDYTFENRSVIVELKHISNVSAGNNIRTYPGLVEAHMKHGLNPRTGYPEFSKWSEAEIAQYKRFFLMTQHLSKRCFRKLISKSEILKNYSKLVKRVVCFSSLIRVIM